MIIQDKINQNNPGNNEIFLNRFSRTNIILNEKGENYEVKQLQDESPNTLEILTAIHVKHSNIPDEICIIEEGWCNVSDSQDYRTYKIYLDRYAIGFTNRNESIEYLKILSLKEFSEGPELIEDLYSILKL